MRDLYTRLEQIGYDQAFVREAVLPDWWDDASAAVPFNRALAESAIASHLGLPLAALRDPKATLPPVPAGGAAFKRNPKKDVSRLLPRLAAVRRAADLIVALAADLPAVDLPASAADIRAEITRGHRPVDLASLVEVCWQAGVPVLHAPATGLLKKSLRFDGVALTAGGRPVVALTSGRDGPPWLAFHLAHELGHVVLGHVAPGVAVVDTAIHAVADDQQERAADRFAGELLTGDPDGLRFTPSFGLRGKGLARAAVLFAEQHRVPLDPGVVCLCYCRSAGRWGVAQDALEELRLEAGGGRIVADELRAHLPADDVPDSAARFLAAVCGVAVGAAAG